MNKQISFQQLFFAFSREIELLWKFTKTDLLVSVVSASIFMLVALFRWLRLTFKACFILALGFATLFFTYILLTLATSWMP